MNRPVGQPEDDLRKDSSHGLILRWVGSIALAMLLWSPAVGQPLPDYSTPPQIPTLPKLPNGAAPPPLPSLRVPAWPPSGPLTMEDAIDVALVRSPALRGAMAEVEAAVARVYQAATGYSPRVQLQYSATRYQQPLGVPFTTTIFGRSQVIQAASFTLTQFEDQLTVRQLISDGGRVHQLVEQNLALARAAYGDLAWAVLQFKHQVRDAYLGVLEARAEEAVAEEAAHNAEAHLKLAQASFQAGVSARADMTFARTPLSRALSQLAEARNLIRSAQARFNALIGADPTGSVAIAPAVSIPEPGGGVEALRREAQARRPDVEARREEERSWRAAAEAARRVHSVNVDAALLGHELGYGNGEAVPPHPGWSAGLIFSYPLWDGGLSRQQAAEAMARARGAAARREGLSRDVDQQVVEAWLAVQDTLERMALSEAEVRDAREGLDVAEGQYRAGVNTIVNVLDAQVALQRARTEAVRARYGHQRALSRLYMVAGQ